MAETITMPKLGFDMQEGTLVRWVRSEGEAVNKGDVLAEIETDKATVEVKSSAGGVVRQLLVDQGAIVPIGAPIAIIGTADEKIDLPAAATQLKPMPVAEPPGLKPETPAGKSRAETMSPPAGATKASPLARRLARDAKVDLAQLRGSGPAGRITRKDVEAALAQDRRLRGWRSRHGDSSRRSDVA